MSRPFPARRSLLAPLLGFLLTVGCGDDGGAALDAAVDAGEQPDAPDAASTSGTCGAQTAPVPGILFVFNRPDGSLIGTAVTDVDGKASRDDCVADTTISWVAFGTSTAIFTMAGVQPGDTVVMNMLLAGPDQFPATSAQITVDANVAALDSPDYYVHTTCHDIVVNGSSGFADTALIYPDCLGDDGLFDSLSIARSGGSTGPIVGYAEARDIAPLEGATPVAVGPWVPVETPAQIEVTVENAPESALEVSIGASYLRDGVRFLSSQSDQPLASGAATAALEALPGDFFDGLGASVSLSYSTSVAHGFRWGRALESAFTVDLSTGLLPRIVDMEVSSPDGSARPVVTWFADGSLEAADGIDFFFNWNGGAWFVVTPDAAAGSFQVPEMPERLAPYLPGVEDQPRMLFALVFDYGWASYTDLVTRAWYPATLGLVADWYEPPADFFMGFSLWANTGP